MLRPGGRVRPSGGKEGYGGRAGGGTWHGNAESESWQVTIKRKVGLSKVFVQMLCFLSEKKKTQSAKFRTLSDPEREDTEEADECCCGLEMDMGESALWGDMESLCCSSDPMLLLLLPSTQLVSCSDTGPFGGDATHTTKTKKKSFRNRYRSCGYIEQKTLSTKVVSRQKELGINAHCLYPYLTFSFGEQKSVELRDVILVLFKNEKWYPCCLFVPGPCSPTS